MLLQAYANKTEAVKKSKILEIFFSEKDLSQYYLRFKGLIIQLFLSDEVCLLRV